jgi:hypothetical protein
VAASVEELAFDLARESLSAQRDVLKDVRARSATLLTASSVVTSFVGGRSIDAVGLNVITAAAIVAFFFAVLPAIYVVAATAEGSFFIDGARLYADLASTDVSLQEAYIALAVEIRMARRANHPLVFRGVWSLRLGFAALILEVILFLAALAVH